MSHAAHPHATLSQQHLFGGHKWLDACEFAHHTGVQTSALCRHCPFCKMFFCTCCRSTRANPISGNQQQVQKDNVWAQQHFNPCAGLQCSAYAVHRSRRNKASILRQKAGKLIIARAMIRRDSAGTAKQTTCALIVANLMPLSILPGIQAAGCSMLACRTPHLQPE